MLRQKHKLEHLLTVAQTPRATFYYHLKLMDSTDKYEAAKAEIMAIYHENIGRRNIPLNHKTVQRLMKELGLVCRVRMKKYRSYKGEAGKIAPNLLNRDFHAEKPNLKWVTDVTEFSLFGEKLPDESNLILHSDQGWQYQHKHYQAMLREKGVRQSMDLLTKHIKIRNKGVIRQEKRRCSASIQASYPSFQVQGRSGKEAVAFRCL